MLRLSAYIDETGHSRDKQQKFVGMAGLIAPAANWTVLEEKWKAAITHKHFDLPYFHMTDFACRKKLFEGWSETKRQRLFGKLIKIIESIYPIPFGAIVPMESFRELSQEQQDFFIDPYFLSFQSLVAASTTFLEAMNIPKEEKIDLFFSDQVEFRSRASQIYKKIEEIGLYTYRSTQPRFLKMREFASLQAADIVAYEMYKEFERRSYRTTSNPRFGFTRLEVMSRRRNLRNPLFRFFTKSDLSSLTNEFERTKKIKEYLENKLEKPS